MYVKCRRCESYGVQPVRRSIWRKLLGRPNRYVCIDCGTRFMPTEEDRVGLAEASPPPPGPDPR